MSNEQNCILRISKTKIFREEENCVWVDMGPADTFIRQILMAYGNPNMAVVQERGEDDE